MEIKDDLNLDGDLFIKKNKVIIDKYVLKSDQFIVTGTGSTQTVNYTTFASTLTGVKQYKIFQKQTSSGTINIDSDTPVYTGSLTSVNLTITTGVEYKYIVVADINYYGVENTNSFTNPKDIVYTVDGIQINGTSAVMSWGALGSGNTYTIQYSEGQTLSATPTEVTTTDTTIVLSGLTPSNATTGVLQYYTFKIIAKSSGGVTVGDSTPTTSYILSTPAVTSLWDSSSTISGATATKSGTIVTMTTPTNHGLVQGDIITTAGPLGYSRSQVFVSSIVSPKVFTYTSISAGATTATDLTLTKYAGFKKVWNYYPFRTALASLETGTKRILPRIFDIYRNPANYANELIFPVSKYPSMGVVTSSWYALEPKVGDGEKVVIVDNNGNSSILMKRSTYTIEGTPLMRFTSVSNDDHRGYKVVHGGGIVVDKGNSNSVGLNIWMTLDTSFNENLVPINYPNVPSELLGSGAALPVNFLLSGYTVFFDGVGQRIIIIKKDGTGKTIIPVSSVAGLALAFTSTIANFTYAIHDNISDCTIGIIGGSNVYKLRFNWNTMTCSVVSTISGITQNYNATEENALGYEFMTHFDLDKNACSIITYKSGVAGNVTISDSLATFTTYSDFVNDPGVNMILPTVNNSGSTQCGMNPVWMMDTLGSIYWVDWGHDDNGLYANVNDAGLGIVKMKDMSIHPRLVSNI